ncbi:hypothetical protein [Roseospira visakhapatnamensis]|uniref:Uncharacterized protein n=1 Tax=Roseospira visakhapatnamensis TaxID=390880 RepID=A0A7W6RE60_9PROT|nr:hypothetical protein [Roseospira visakhapatnamensis]MBB4266891.1 hypothetical protein [Roseospira visakhapatnamensis]
MTERQTYTVATGQPLAILGRMHRPGSTVELHPRQADAHLRTGALVAGAPVDTAKPARPRRSKATTKPAEA